MKPRGSILLADDEEKIVRILGRALRDEGHEVVEATSSVEAKALVFRRAFDLLIVDNVMPEVTGVELIREVVETLPETERPQFLLMTGQPTIDGAIEALKLGALDYLRKPFEVEHLLAAVQRAVQMRQLRVKSHLLRDERDHDPGEDGMVGRSPAIAQVLRATDLVATSKSTVLISGETGTGKELVARAIHARSAERARPFVKVNCAAIPDNLLESELFGYVRGAFTGAVTSKRGKFALADGGTIFLDEIGTLSMCLQPKILRVLQEREFEPLGAERTEHIDVRVVAATNRDLAKMVGEGKFLEDLYYRLNVIPLHIPPLRERSCDIPLLVEHFIRKHSKRMGKKIQGIEQDAMQSLVRHTWPGNVRELENTVERAVVLSAGPVIKTADVAILGGVGATEQMASLPSMSLRDNIEWVEKETVRRALGSTHGVKKFAADLLGISQRALSYYLSKHQIE